MKRFFVSLILVFFAHLINGQNIGINTSSPSQKLEVNGKVKIGDDTNTPSEGSVRWNSVTKDFEGFDGNDWRSLTKNNLSSWGYSDLSEKENRKIIANDGAASERFGNAVSISGDYIIVGSHMDNVGGNSGQGSAYIFMKSGSNWIQQAKLTASDGAVGDVFGYSVSISGIYAIVGCPSDNVGTNSDQGSAYIFIRNGNSWTQQAKLTASDGAANDGFGNSVSIDGDYVAIGTVTDDIGANFDQGSAYIFKRDGTNWSQQTKLSASDGAEGDYFGYSISISGDYVVVGASSAEVSGNGYQGAAYIFIRNGTNWTQQTKLIAADGEFLDYFGQSVSISGDYVVVGSPFGDVGSNSNQGSAYVFIRSGTIWTQQVKLSALDGVNEDNFGKSVSISGDYIIVGASYDNIVNNSDQGSAYIFNRNGTSWIQQTKISSSDGGVQDYFGNKVAISDNYAVVGSEYNNVGGNADQGGVYIYNKNQ